MQHRPGPPSEATSVALEQTILGYQPSQAVYVAAKLGIADLLRDGPQHCERLAQATGTHARSLYRVLRYLASVGIFTERRSAEFELTPRAACLQTGAPGSRRALAILNGEESYRAWGALLHSVQSGEPAFDHVFGEGVFDYLAAHPEAASVFNEGMTDLATQMAEAVTQVYDFAPIGTIVDVGGGHGGLLTALLDRHAHAKGVLFDQPHVAAAASRHIAASGHLARCTVVAGDFFGAVPVGGDAYLLARVIHDWDDARSVAILENCRRALTSQAKLLVIERVIPPGNQPSIGKLTDLNMLVMTSGCERTETEYRALLAAAGIRLCRTISTGSPFSVLEGMRA
jgi:hypothetical protein